MRVKTTHKRLRRLPTLICLFVLTLLCCILYLSLNSRDIPAADDKGPEQALSIDEKADPKQTKDEHKNVDDNPTATDEPAVTDAIKATDENTDETPQSGEKEENKDNTKVATNNTTTETESAPREDTKCFYEFQCSAHPQTANYERSELLRFLNFVIPTKIYVGVLDMYKPEELSNTPAISGGLYTDRQDLEKPRDGEKYVTFAEYLDCLSRNLRVDYHKQREEELTDAEVQQSFPYVVSMATVELGDIKALMCNINVPIRHMMYVINSDVTSVTNFFHDVEKTFAFTNRLRVVWPGYNMGFAGSVNFAMRDAMRYPFDEVPFFFILNNDIRFPEETLPRALPEFRKVTGNAKAMLEGLRAEVAKEPSEYTPANRRRPLLRSSDNSTLLVTSPSLPDRIRYMPYEERKKIFEKYCGGLFFDPEKDTATFGMSRLAIETVGFMDENFYPAYYEDTDWRYRQFRLGLFDFFVKGIPSKKHFVNALLNLGNRYMLHPNHATEAEIFAQHITNVVIPMPNLRMVFMKYGMEKHEVHEVYHDCHELPLDAWVMDIPRRAAIMKALHLSSKYFGDASQEESSKKQARRILSWLPQEQRAEIGRGIVSQGLSQVVPRAFNECRLVLHDKK